MQKCAFANSVQSRNVSDPNFRYSRAQCVRSAATWMCTNYVLAGHHKAARSPSSYDSIPDSRFYQKTLVFYDFIDSIKTKCLFINTNYGDL